MDEHVRYEYDGGMFSMVTNGSNIGTHKKVLVAIIGQLTEEDFLDEDDLIEIEQKIQAIRKQKYKGVWYYGE